MLYHERKAKDKGFRIIVGIDEAGRGPLAGSVVAAAIVLKKDTFKNRIYDSKKLNSLARLFAFREILNNAHVGVGVVNERAIDTTNILIATSRAMELAALELVHKIKKRKPTLKDRKICLLVDGRVPLDLPFYKKDIIKGDRKSLSCAAASIVAKVIRDRMMHLYHKIYPDYGFINHKGYATEKHVRALKKFGPSPIHRQTFRLKNF